MYFSLAQKNKEEIASILYFTPNSSTISNEVADADEIKMVILPFDGGQDSDSDDATSDAEEKLTIIKCVKRYVLSQTAQIRTINAFKKEI